VTLINLKKNMLAGDPRCYDSEKWIRESDQMDLICRFCFCTWQCWIDFVRMWDQWRLIYRASDIIWHSACVEHIPGRVVNSTKC